MTKQWGVKEWRTYYSNPTMNSALFVDYKILAQAEQRRSLSSAEEAQKEVIEEMLDEILSK